MLWLGQRRALEGNRLRLISFTCFMRFESHRHYHHDFDSPWGEINGSSSFSIPIMISLPLHVAVGLSLRNAVRLVLGKGELPNQKEYFKVISMNTDKAVLPKDNFSRPTWILVLFSWKRDNEDIKSYCRTSIVIKNSSNYWSTTPAVLVNNALSFWACLQSLAIHRYHNSASLPFLMVPI